ncbi:MAG: hypothetical protein AAF546_02980 [Verrucomicrobiota bacterium]
MSLAKIDPNAGRLAIHLRFFSSMKLYSIFPDGKRGPGSVPCNAAWALQGFGLHLLFVSAVGVNAQVRSIWETMRSLGLTTIH